MSESKSEVVRMRFYCHTQEDGNKHVYMSGSFNGWNVYDEKFRMKHMSSGIYYLDIEMDVSKHSKGEYLYTHGGWGEVERDVYGNKVPNRKWALKIKEYHDHVPRWADEGRSFNARFLPIREVISSEYYIPQLGKTRRIQVLLPYDYNETEWSYPVMYLHDGQNLFDKYAPFGTWAIDEKLAVMAEKGIGNVIIVAIDHGGADRISEYTPFGRHALSEGRNYVRFIVDSLKPDIDRRYRTLTDRMNTGIGGSSMGGLISIYAGLMEPKVFSKLMIFSPSLWVNRKVYFDIINFRNAEKAKIYVYAGGAESQNMIPNVVRLKNAIEGQGQDKSKISLKLSLDPEGKHNESYWGAEFPRALEWLFFTAQELY